MFQSGTNHALEVGVVKIVGQDGADIFMRQVNSRHALIVGLKRYGDPEHPIQ